MLQRTSARATQFPYIDYNYNKCFNNPHIISLYNYICVYTLEIIITGLHAAVSSLLSCNWVVVML